MELSPRAILKILYNSRMNFAMGLEERIRLNELKLPIVKRGQLVAESIKEEYR
jgi:hypothetical protein